MKALFNLARRARYSAIAMAAASAMLAAGPLKADDAKGCKDLLWPVGKELAAFRQADLKTLQSGATQGAWAAGTAFILQLKPQDDVKLAVAPTGKEMDKAKAPPLAGLITFEAPAKAGVFHVTLSSHAWIEVVQDGKALPATAFTGANDCPVRKSVRFEIGKAPVTLQISNAETDAMKIAIVPAVD